MGARRLASVVGLSLALALSTPAAAGLRELCAKGGIALPAHVPVIGQPGLTGIQCKGGYEDSCVAIYKLGFKPEAHLAGFDPLQIAKCRCYATCLLTGGEATGGFKKAGASFDGVKDPDVRKNVADYLTLMDQFDVYLANNAPPASPSPGQPPPAGGDAASRRAGTRSRFSPKP
jgi:hypothetical protein